MGGIEPLPVAGQPGRQVENGLRVDPSFVLFGDDVGERRSGHRCSVPLLVVADVAADTRFIDSRCRAKRPLRIARSGPGRDFPRPDTLSPLMANGAAIAGVTGGGPRLLVHRVARPTHAAVPHGHAHAARVSGLGPGAVAPRQPGGGHLEHRA